MKTLNFDQLASIQGGTGSNFIAGVCAGTGMVRAGAGVAIALGASLVIPGSAFFWGAFTLGCFVNAAL